jgi:hypothetical protein
MEHAGERYNFTIMNKSVAAAFLLGGIVLLYLGYQSSQSASSIASRIFTGSHNGRTIWMSVAGAIATVAGIIGLSSSK